ncbi:MAG TPA: VOC family protein [Ohtaekwangia sp.]|nr:VOC family protein [Ohtaekwangia sp.]
MEFLKIKETCLYVRDLEMAKTFYNERLGLPVINYVAGKHIFFRAGSSVLLCFNPHDSKEKTSPPAHYGRGKQHFAFEVTKAAYEKAKQEILDKGITITDYVTWPSGTESFYFEDLEGNVLEIVPDAGIWD